MAVFIIFLVIVLIVIVMYGNEILRGSFKVQVVKFLPLGIFKEDKNKDKDSKIDNREESIKLARDIKAKGGVGPKKIGLSYSKDDPLNKIKRKINSILKE